MTRRHAQWLIVIKKLANLSRPPTPKAPTQRCESAEGQDRSRAGGRTDEKKGRQRHGWWTSGHARGGELSRQSIGMLQWTCVIPGTSVGSGSWPVPIRRVRLAANPPVWCVGPNVRPGSPDQRNACNAREACYRFAYTRILRCQNSQTGVYPICAGRRISLTAPHASATTCASSAS